MQRELFADSTDTTGSMDIYLGGALPIDSIKLWDRPNDETDVIVLPLTWRERVFICWLVCTQVPDGALDKLTDSIVGTIDFYRERYEYRQRQRPKLPPRTVTVELGKTTVRPRLYLPTDAD